MTIEPYTGLIAFAIVVAGSIWLKQYLLKVVNEPEGYPEYLIKLSAITGKNQYDFFVIAGEECNIPTYLIERDWKTYITTRVMPTYMIDFLDEGKEYIDDIQILA